jgi:hypothetical protein
MELLCIKDYSDTLYRIKAGESTEMFADMTDEYKASIVADYPEKFKVIKKEKESELVIEHKDPVIETSNVKFTKKAAKG